VLLLLMPSEDQLISGSLSLMMSGIHCIDLFLTSLLQSTALPLQQVLNAVTSLIIESSCYITI